jgi:uncharacterized protein
VFFTIEASLFPFCSQRCKLIDLSHWLNEDYGLPYEDEKSPDMMQNEDHENEDHENAEQYGNGYFE